MATGQILKRELLHGENQQCQGDIKVRDYCYLIPNNSYLGRL